MSSFATNPQSYECGIKIAQRLWPLPYADSVVRPGEMIDECCEVLVFSLKSDSICRSPTAFDQFNRQLPNVALVEAFWQLVWRGLEKAQQSMYSKDAQQFTRDDFPIKVFLECVLENDDERMADLAADYELSQKRIALEHMRKLYGADLVSAEQLMKGAKSGMASGVFSQEHVERIPFMRRPTDDDVRAAGQREDTRNYEEASVYEYRFWLISRDPAVRLSEHITAVIEETGVNVDKYFGSGPFEQSRGGGKAGGGGGGGGGHGSNRARMADMLADDEKWALLHKPIYLMHAVHAYLGDKRLSLEAMREKCLSPSVKLNNPRNPINPYNVLNAEDHFKTIENSVIRDAAQTRYRNYYRGNKTFSFPLPHCVLRVQPEWFSVSYIRHMYTPDSQRRLIEPRLDRRIMLRQQAHRGRRFTDDNDDEFSIVASGNASALDIDRDGTEYVRGGEVIVPDIVDMPVDADNVGGNDDDSSSSSTDDGENEAALNAALGLGDPDAPDVPAADNSQQPAAAEETESGAPGRDGVRVLPAVDNSMPGYAYHMDSGNYVSTADDQGNNVSWEMQRKMTHLHTLRAEYHDRMCRFIDGLRDPPVRAREKLLMQVRALDEYKAKCTESCSNVPPVGKKINAWMEERMSVSESNNNDGGGGGCDGDKAQFGLRFTDCGRPFTDPDLSLFAHMVLREYEQLESCHFLYTAHSETFFLRLAALTAYRYKFDCLRLNVLLFGPEQTSKSYPITVTRKWMIKDTVQSVTTQSALADAVDQDDNDMPKCFEEFPNELLASGGKADAQRQNAFKDMLTRNRYERQVCMLLDNGERVQRIVVSEKHTAYLGATNMLSYQFDMAIKSRFVMRHQVARDRPGYDISQKKIEQENNSVANKVRYDHAVHNMQLRQTLHFHVEKLIMIGMLDEPSLTVFSLFYTRFKKMLSKNCAVKIHRRIDEQVGMFLRTLVIQRAVDWLHHSPDSPFYNSERVSMWHLLCVNPLLTDSLELVLFALDNFRASFINPNEEAVIRTLRRITQTRIEKYGVERLFESRRDKERRRNKLLHQVLGGDEPARLILPSTTANMTPEQRLEAQRRAQAEAAERERQLNERDYNYVAMKMPLSKLATVVHNEMRRDDSSRKLNRDTVGTVIKTIAAHKIYAPPYVRTTKRGNSDAAKQQPPVEPTPGVPTDQFDYCSTIRISEDDKMVYIHSALLFNEAVDPHEAAIRDCLTPYVEPGERYKFVSGTAVDDAHPHLLGTRDITVGDYNPIVELIEPVEQPRTDDDQTDHGPINMTYDDYATRHRLRLLGIPLTRYAYTRCHMRLSDQRARRVPGALANKLIDYPRDWKMRTDQFVNTRKQLTERFAGVSPAAMRQKYEQLRQTDAAFKLNNNGFADGPPLDAYGANVPLAADDNDDDVEDDDEDEDETALFSIRSNAARRDAPRSTLLQNKRSREPATITPIADNGGKRRRTNTMPVDAGYSNGPGVALDYAAADDNDDDSFAQESFYARVIATQPNLRTTGGDDSSSNEDIDL
jgi:hypothetical protein